jgi:hypothetical protein
MTNTPLQDQWGKAADKFTLIPHVLFEKLASCPPLKGSEVKLTAPQIFLLLQLISYWWPTRKRHPFPSYAALAKRTGMSKKTIGSHLVQLEKKGWLNRIKRWHEGNNYSGWSYDLSPTKRRLDWLTNLPHEKEQIPEEAEGPGLSEGSEALVEVTPEPAAPPSYDHLRPVEPHPGLMEARLKLLTQIRRRGGVEQKEGLVERIERLTEIRRQRTGV